MTISARDKLKQSRLSVEEKYLDLAIKGDPIAFGELVAAYEKTVYNVAYSAVLNSEDAFDLSQEIFLKAWLSIGKFRKESSFSTWLHKIAFNAIYDFAKEKNKKIPSISIHEYTNSDGGSEIQLYDPSEDVAEQISKKEIGRTITDGIDRLPDEFRTIFILRDIEGLGYEEIAEIENVSIGTVKSRINRARRKLCEFLKDKI